MSRRDKVNWLILIVLALFLPGCAETQFLISSSKRLQSTETDGIYKVGTPYQIAGTWYYPAEDWDYDETGIASWYGPNFHGKDTANGESYDMNAMTAAHRTLPMPSFVRVTNLENGRAIVLRVNDRGPFAKGRIIDVSRRGAQLLGFETQGTARVRVQILAERSLALKAAMQGGKIPGGGVIAKEDSPIQVDRLPKATVSAESLPPPPGAQASSSSKRSPAAQKPAVPHVDGQQIAAAEEIKASSQPEPEVETVPVTPTNIFVQAGAFTNYQNALRTQLKISRRIKATISHVLIDDRDFYRVRVGPLASVDEADRALEQVQTMGYPGAQIIVDAKKAG